MRSAAESVSVRDAIDGSNDFRYTRVGEQLVSDNIGIQMTSPYGLRSLHDMVGAIVTPESSYHATENWLTMVAILQLKASKHFVYFVSIAVCYIHPSEH